MSLKIINKHKWENSVKYLPFIQRLFLLWRLSCNFPTTLNIEPTNYCNLDCLFCPVTKTNRPRGFINLKLYQKIIDEVADAQRLKILWLNKDGEPLLHPKIDKLVEYAKAKKIADRIEIYTNGVLLNKTIAEKLIKAGLDSLVVSLDATDSKTFKKLKQKDLYDRVVENIKNFLKLRQKLKSLKPLLSVKMVAIGEASTSHLCHCEEVGTTKQSIEIATVPTAPRNDTKSIQTAREKIEIFKKQWQGIADCVIIQKLHEWEGSMEQISNFKFLISNYSDRYPCNLPWLAPAINWDGTVVPCCVNFRKNELILGDLKKQSLIEVWQSDSFRKLRQAHLDLDFVKYPTCARCTFWRQLPGMKTILNLKFKMKNSKPQFKIQNF